MSLLALVQALPGIGPPRLLPVDPGEGAVAGVLLLLGLDIAARVAGTAVLPMLRGTGRRSQRFFPLEEIHP